MVRGSPGIKGLRKSRHDHFLAAGSQSPPQVVWRVSVGEIDQRGVECGIPSISERPSYLFDRKKREKV